MGTCILYGKMKVEAAKIASTSSNSAFCLPDCARQRKSDLLEVEILQYRVPGPRAGPGTVASASIPGYCSDMVQLLAIVLAYCSVITGSQYCMAKRIGLDAA